MDGTPGQSEYSIAAVSKLAGVSCHALRVWERRYGYPVPHRSPSGHRRYSPEQVRALQGVARLLRTGRAVGDLLTEARTGRLDLEQVPEVPVEPTGTWSPSRLVDRLIAGDIAAAEACYQEAARSLSLEALVSDLLEPALIDVGERWFRRECYVCEERCACGFVRRKIERLLDEAQMANSQPRHTAVLGTVQGDRHEGGVLVVALWLELKGWRAITLGSDLPVREFQRAIEVWHPDALVVSFVLSRNINKRFQELEQIEGIPVFVGGRSILNYQGLARRHGLIPLPGSAARAVPHLLAEFETWRHHEPAQKGHNGQS